MPSALDLQQLARVAYRLRALVLLAEASSDKEAARARETARALLQAEGRVRLPLADWPAPPRALPPPSPGRALAAKERCP